MVSPSSGRDWVMSIVSCGVSSSSPVTIYSFRAWGIRLRPALTVPLMSLARGRIDILSLSSGLTSLEGMLQANRFA